MWYVSKELMDPKVTININRLYWSFAKTILKLICWLKVVNSTTFSMQVSEEPVLVMESVRLASPLSSPLSVSHQVQLLQRQLQQQEQRSQAASAQVTSHVRSLCHAACINLYTLKNKGSLLASMVPQRTFTIQKTFWGTDISQIFSSVKI